MDPKPPVPDGPRVQRWFTGLLAGAVILVLLVQARFFLIPLAIALLIFSLTTAVIDFFARQRIGSFHFPQWLATIVAMLTIAATLFVLFGIFSAQIDSVMATVPAYVDRIQESVADLFVWIGDDVAQSVLVAFQDINIGEYTRAFAGSAGNLLLTIVLIILYVGFMFAERPSFEAKIARLFPEPAQAARVNGILASISRSVHHYVLVKTAVSALTAAVVYAIFVAYGLDFAESLAILVFILNFIPNIGSILATLLPTLVALVQFDAWVTIISIMVIVGTIQFVIGNVVDPMLMGRALHLSSFAIILSLTFWGAVWGVIGMFLAVPIMVIVMIVCSHVPSLRGIAILLSRGGEPAPVVVVEKGEGSNPGA